MAQVPYHTLLISASTTRSFLAQLAEAVTGTIPTTPDGDEWSVVECYDGRFSPKYAAASSRTAVSLGYTFRLKRAGAGPALRSCGSPHSTVVTTRLSYQPRLE